MLIRSFNDSGPAPGYDFSDFLATVGAAKKGVFINSLNDFKPVDTFRAAFFRI
jgi:hypothetical protein